MEQIRNNSWGVKRILHIVYLVLVVVVGATGIMLNVTGTRVGIGCFVYYTVQSNALCVLVALFYIQQEFSKRRISERLSSGIHGAIVMCIMLTFLVFYFLLRKTIPATGDFLGPGNVFLHYILPLMVAGEYLFFYPKGTFRIRWVGWWAIIPAAYGVFAFTYSALGGRFGYDKYLVPYPFMDYTVLGIGGVALWLLGIATGYIVLSVALVGLDNLLARLVGKIKKAD